MFCECLAITRIAIYIYSHKCHHIIYLLLVILLVSESIYVGVEVLILNIIQVSKHFYSIYIYIYMYIHLTDS